MKQKIRVAIIDDNLGIRDLVSSYIEMQEDMEIAGMAEDGIEGINLIHETKPDVVILDMIMPRLDGLGVLEHISMSTRLDKPFFICLSAVGQEELIQRAVKLGAKYYMIKPFDMEMLMRRIRELTTNKQGLGDVEYKQITRDRTKRLEEK